MSDKFRKIIAATLILSELFWVSGAFSFPSGSSNKTKAAIEEVPFDESEESFDDEEEPESDSGPSDSLPGSYLDFLEKAYPDDENGDLSIEDQIQVIKTPKIVLNSDDAFAIRSLHCLGKLSPNFDEDLTSLMETLPAKSRPSNEKELQKIKGENKKRFSELTAEARKTWAENNQGLILNDSQSLSCITGLSANEVIDLRKTDPEYLKAVVEDAIESIIIDIRVLKTLVYLVTPKNKGGAGHYRVKVARIRSGYTSKRRQFSRESDYILSNQSSGDSATTSSDASTMTAAEIGLKRAEATEKEATTENITLEVEGENGTEYDAYLSEQIKNEDEYAKQLGNVQTEAKPNISAHSTGQAIDISEIDDIRCTLIEKRRVGSDTKTKYSQTPIKLAWQTKEGYAASGGNDGGDLAGMFKAEASAGIRELIEELGGDLSNFDGDLSQGNFSDIASVIGKSLFSQIINSPGTNFSGYNFGDTLQKIGSIYFADFLGLQREVFIDRKVNSLDDLQRIIGEAAIEERLKLPYGTFDGKSMDEVLLNMGQRKIEYEMGLSTGSLGALKTDQKQNMAALVGQSVIEKSLSLKKGSFHGSNYSDLKKNIGKVKAESAFMDSNYVDNILHLDLGTTEKLKRNQLNPTAYAIMVGQIRLDATAYGFKFLSSHDSAYNLPEGTWTGALSGNKEALKDIGLSTISRSFATSDDQKQALESWILTNSSKVNTDECIIPPKIEQTIGSGKTVSISEEKAMQVGFASGDLYRMFACSKSNPGDIFERIGSKILYYGVVNYGLDPESKAKIDLMDTNPNLKISPMQKVEFYLSRIQEADQIIKRVKKNWENSTLQYNNSEIKGSIDDIIDILGNPEYRKSKESVQDAARRVAVSVGVLKENFQETRDSGTATIEKINATLIDVDRLSQIVSEIFNDNSIPSASSLQLNQISGGIFSSNDYSTAGSSGTNNSWSKLSSASQKVNRVALMLLLARRTSPKSFLMSLGISKAETELNLPENSLNYYVENTEKKGLSSKDAFYMSIGQAKIEEEFNMPSYYFQGRVSRISSMPDFENDYDALVRYNGIKTSDQFYGSTKDYFIEMKSDNPDMFALYQQEAEKNFSSSAKKFLEDSEQKGNSKSYEETIDDVIANIKTSGLTDGIRSPQDDLLLRMGISGSFDALTNNSSIAWSTAAKRADEIDKKFFLKSGTTRSLFTGSFVPSRNGKYSLGKEEKKLIAAKLGLSPTALEKYLQVLNGDLKVKDLEEEGQGIFYNATNSYAGTSQNATESSCPNPFKTNGQGLATSPEFSNDSFGFRDKDGLVFAKNPESARQAKDAEPSKKIDYLTELAAGFKTISGSSENETKNQIRAYLSNKDGSLFDLSAEKMASISESTDIPEATLEKLFTREKALMVNKPLQAYKRAVGQVEANRLIGWKLFQSLGINVDSSLFDSGDLFEILNGNYKPLYEIGSTLIDNRLNLPPGTTVGIIQASNSDVRNCILAEAGGNMLGQLVGLNNVSIKGNLLTNFGQAKIEETLSLPRGTFGGQNLSELINRVGPLNFALAFKIPVSDLVDDETINSFFAGSNTEWVKKLNDSVILKKIKYEVESSSTLSSSSASALAKLNEKLSKRILAVAGSNAQHWSANYSIADGHENYARELSDFLEFISSLDSTFSVPTGSTKNLLNGGITPDDYRDLVANKTLQNIAKLKILDLFGIDGYKSEQVYDLMRDFKEMIEDQKYGDIYSALNQIFRINLDAKAGFSQGTFALILNDPKSAPKVLLTEGIKEIDRRLGLDPEREESLTGIYSFYKGSMEDCNQYILSAAEEAQLKDEEIKLAKAAPTINFAEDNSVAARMGEISGLREKSNEGYQTCKKEKREALQDEFLSKSREYLEGKASEIISEKIRQITKDTIDMPLGDIIEFVKKGDLRYFQAMGLAYAANVITNAAGHTVAVLPGMRITYADIALSIFGNKEAEAAAEQAAIHSYASGGSPKAGAAYAPFRYGDVCSGEGSLVSGAIKCLQSDAFLEANPDGVISRELPSLVDANKAYLQKHYGYDPNDASANSATQAMYDTKFGSKIALAESDGCKSNPQNAECQDAIKAVAEIERVKEGARRESRKAFASDLQFRAADAMLWKLDKNAYPGFSYAMLKGDAQMKQFAMATYLRNGILRGELFGIDIGIKLPRIDEWAKTYTFFKDMSAPGALDKFMSEGGGYAYVNDFINKKANDWFGFDLPPDMVGSLVVGLSTGVWSTKSLNPNDIKLTTFDASNGTYKGANGKLAIPTLEKVAQNWVESKIFGWADKMFGWEAGTAYKVYDMYRTYQKAKEAYEAAKAANDVAAMDEAEGNLGDFEAAAVAFIVNTLFSEQIAAAEEALGLVPGTGAMVVEMAAQYFFAGAINPVVAALFVYYNLTGVYKVELKCTADGYYPEIESFPAGRLDTTKLGVWNGMSQSSMEWNSIKAAQYKAKRLIGDMLVIQDKPKYKDIIPSQIMTGRQQDVDFWDSAISSYICGKMGSKSVKGICGGNTKAGVWKNPQTVAVTHIGF